MVKEQVRGPQEEQEQEQEQETQLDLATVNRSAMSRALKVDIAHVSRILSGRRKPSLELAMKMAQYLEVSLDTFYNMLPQRG